MRPANVFVAALAAAPVAVSAGGTLGFALGATNPDQSSSCKSTSDYEADFAALNDHTKLVRVYSTSQCNQAQNILPAAKNAGFKVLLGVWPDSDESFNNDTAALQASVPGYEDVIFGITVGSEALYRGSLTATQLLSKIQQVESMFPNILVGTADSWNKYADGTADPLISGGVKLLLANAFSYWQGQDIGNATASYFDDVQQAIGHIQEVSGSLDAIHIMTGETGWPTDGGTDYEAAHASTQNAYTFYQSGICGMLDWGVDVFYFEAFDEPGKPVTTGTDGKPADERHWGAFNTDRSAKFDLTCGGQ